MSRTYTITEVNQLSESEFIDLLGGLYEHSRWVVEQVVSSRPFADRDELEAVSYTHLRAHETKATSPRD